MSTTLETLMRDWFENAWNRGDETTIDRLMHPDAVIHGLPAADGWSRAWNCFDFLSLYQQLGARLDLSAAPTAAGV